MNKIRHAIAAPVEVRRHPKVRRSTRRVREIALAREACSVVDPERERYVESLRRAVSAGTFNPDPMDIAAAILRHDDTLDITDALVSEPTTT